MRIGLFGFEFMSSNKGCEALTYSFLDMISNIYTENTVEVYNFSYSNSMGLIPNIYKNILFKNFRLKFKSIFFWRNAIQSIKECDVFFDATYGDGFSDIYGKKWNVKTDLIKQIILWCKIPLVLVPQTYGPYTNRILEKWAVKLIRNARLVYSRDELSAQIIKERYGMNINVSSDMAFKLPYNKKIYQFKTDKIRIGINISSLLWDSEWSKDNYFNIKINYQEFHSTLIEYLISVGKYEIHIIPHVIDLEHSDSRENDYRVCLEIGEKYGSNIIVAYPFRTPIEAKSYISNMDIFIGSRMHATIGAISSGVATIPFSYSRKFEGLFGNLNYPYIISAKKISTEEALQLTKEWIENYYSLKKVGSIAKDIALKKLDNFEKDIKDLLKNYIGK